MVTCEQANGVLDVVCRWSNNKNRIRKIRNNPALSNRESGTHTTPQANNTAFLNGYELKTREVAYRIITTTIITTWLDLVLRVYNKNYCKPRKKIGQMNVNFTCQPNFLLFLCNFPFHACIDDCMSFLLGYTSSLI